MTSIEDLFPKCACGKTLYNKRQKKCVDCLKLELLSYCSGATERMSKVPLIQCPRCKTSKYTKLTLNGVCIDCWDVEQKIREREKQMKPKSLQDKVRGFAGGFMEKSQPKEEEIPF